MSRGVVMEKYSKEFIEWARSLKMSKRAREALEIMINKGAVTTVDLQEQYHLNHPPRALADLKDAGISFSKCLVKTSDGKRIAQYELQDIISKCDEAPRRSIPKKVKNDLIKDTGSICTACGGVFKSTMLQVDHRIPFRIKGDPREWNSETMMLLCQSCNRAKSWTCEHCNNWIERNSEICQSCYWCIPDGDYTHVAGKEQRRLIITWQGDEVNEYDKLYKQASDLDVHTQDLIKSVIKNGIDNPSIGDVNKSE